MKDSLSLSLLTESFNFFWILYFNFQYGFVVVVVVCCFSLLSFFAWKMVASFILDLCLSYALRLHSKRDYMWNANEQTLVFLCVQTVAIVNQRTSSNGIHMQNSNINIFFLFCCSLCRFQLYLCAVFLISSTHTAFNTPKRNRWRIYNGGHNEGKLNRDRWVNTRERESKKNQYKKNMEL